jgi:hypothetical protein
MSRIQDLGKSFANLPQIIADYEQAFANITQDLAVKGKMLEVALREQASNSYYYESRKAELKVLLKYMDSQVAKVRGTLIRRYKENYSRDLGERQLNNYVDAETDYLTVYELYLECEELYEKYSAACDAFTKRGFALRDITNARCDSVHDSEL